MASMPVDAVQPPADLLAVWNQSEGRRLLPTRRNRMDEKRTLAILGWIMCSLLAATFLLNAMALSDSAPLAHPYGIAAEDLGYGVDVDHFEIASAPTN
jgi:hypothetical protein